MSQSTAVYDPANDSFAIPRNSAQVEQILATVTHKNDQIDALCEAEAASKSILRSATPSTHISLASFPSKRLQAS